MISDWLTMMTFASCDCCRENDITGIIHNTFSVDQHSFGELQSHDLKPGGSSEEVTELNKKEYVRLYVNWRFMRGIETQFIHLQKGFQELISHHLLRPFDERELEVCLGSVAKRSYLFILLSFLLVYFVVINTRIVMYVSGYVFIIACL